MNGEGAGIPVGGNEADGSAKIVSSGPGPLEALETSRTATASSDASATNRCSAIRGLRKGNWITSSEFLLANRDGAETRNGLALVR